jgi:transcriptional regulator with XRE-family HTH domain
MKNIGERVRQRREQLGYSQEEIASACQVTQQAIQQLEDGTVLRPRYIAELADVLKVTIPWLKRGTADTPYPQGGISPSSGFGDSGFKSKRQKIFQMLDDWETLSAKEQDEFLAIALLHKKEDEDGGAGKRGLPETDKNISGGHGKTKAGLPRSTRGSGKAVK